jgi:N-acetylglucosamine kinase-like BadF-type ATPase
VGVSVVVGVDGGNTKTDVAVATLDGEVVASLRGPGSNSHGLGSAGAVEVIAALVDGVAFERPAEHGAFFLCGADVEQDIAELSAEIDARDWTRAATVDNDTFALLRAGSDRPDAVAVICGAGINCVGRSADGRVARYPSLGWETGDWGGAEAVGREALFLAARAEDGRGEPTVLADVVRAHFGLSTAYAVGEAVHYRRLRDVRLGEVAPAVVAAAADRDVVARQIVERLANEIVLMVRRAFADLGVEAADVVLGGGMLATGDGLLHELVVAGLPVGARAVVPDAAPVAGAVLAALDAVGATEGAKRRVREELRAR